MNRPTKKICLLVPLVAALAACGGGGSDDGGGISYTGSSEPALINSTNARKYTVDSYSTSRSGSGIDPIGVMQASSVREAAPVNGRLQGIMNVVDAALSGVRKSEPAFVPAASGSGMRAASTESNRIAGSCGGSVSYSISGNEQTGRFSGSFSYNGYCEEGATLNGSMTISGTVDQVQEEINSMSVGFDSLQFRGYGEALTLDGTMGLEVSDSAVKMTMNMLARDDQSGEVVKIEDLLFTVTAGAGYEEATISGRFYEPAEGYVDVRTLTPLRVNDGYQWPSSGQLQATGAVGNAGGNTKALLKAQGDSYHVDADTDGDGNPDYSETFSWQDGL